MCGISAIIDPHDRVPAGAIDRMVRSLSHRGPDAHNSRRFGACTLGHTRLSVIDLAGGAQPMTDASGRYAITFNGEIYNYRELRQRLLAARAQLTTASDTEVLLAGYRFWGARLLEQLRGMFAFVIWDTHERTAFAARDLFGEKPLYYVQLADGGVILASELKAIVAADAVPLRVDRRAIDEYLALGYVPPVRTIYTNIKTLPPAHFLRWSQGGLTVERYWQPPLDQLRIDLPEAAPEVRRLLQQAVARQLVADVPVGAFLSGGLDSSTIVALMQRDRPHPVKTFSVGFGPGINELPYARSVAAQYGTDHHEIDLGEPDVGSLLERMSEVYDEPFADSSNIPTFAMCAFARRHVKVVLCGDGGDELFGGYGRYPALATSEGLHGSLVAWYALRGLSRLLRERVDTLHRYSVATGLAYRSPDLAVRCAISQTNIREHQRHTLWGGRGPRNGNAQTFVNLPEPSFTGMRRAFHFDLMCYLPGDILVKVDRAAMAHGLETRAPFLDRDLAEFVLRLPPALKVSGARTKVVFREACAALWPAQVRARKKQGFGAPYARWLKRADVRELLDRTFARNSALRALLPGLPAETPPATFATWILLTLGLWLERQPAHACAES